MKLLIFSFLICYSHFVQADAQKPCGITESGVFSFTDFKAKDTIKLELIGSPCKDAKLTLSINTEDGLEIYRYQYSYVEWLYDYDKPNYREFVSEKMSWLLSFQIGRSDGIPFREECPTDKHCPHGYFPNADMVFESDIPLNLYRELKNIPVPTISHGVGREAWLTIYFDKSSGKVVSLLLNYV